MKVFFKLGVIALILPVFLIADIKVFLYPNAAHDSSAVKVSDIAFVEGGSVESERVREMVIDRKYYADSIIDLRELKEALNGVSSEPVIIYGNGVRLVPKEKEEKPPREIIVFKGDKVDVVVKRKGIVLEFRGIAQKDAASGDRVTVELGKKGYIKGILSPDKVVEIGI